MQGFKTFGVIVVGGMALAACSMEGIGEAKQACIAEVQSRMELDISAVPSGFQSFAGTEGKGTTFTFSQTETTPAIVCNTSNGKVVSITKSETTVVQ